MRAYLGVITILSLLFVAFSDESPGPIVKARLEVGGQHWLHATLVILLQSSFLSFASDQIGFYSNCFYEDNV